MMPSIIGASNLRKKSGMTWSIVSNNLGTSKVKNIIYQNGVYVASSTNSNPNNGYITYSPDGINWVNRQTYPMGFYYLTYANNQFLATTPYLPNRVFYSNDGNTWSSISISSFLSFSSNMLLHPITYGNNGYIVTGKSSNGNLIIYRNISLSSSGWSLVVDESGLPYYISSLFYINNKFKAGTCDIIGTLASTSPGFTGKGKTSPDGLTWSDGAFNAPYTYSQYMPFFINQAAYINSTEYYLSPNGLLVGNGVSLNSNFGSTSLNSMAYGNGLYVIVGNSGKISTSEDGIIWTSRSNNLGTTNLNSVCYDGSKFMLGGDSGLIATYTP